MPNLLPKIVIYWENENRAKSEKVESPFFEKVIAGKTYVKVPALKAGFCYGCAGWDNKSNGRLCRQLFIHSFGEICDGIWKVKE